MLHVLGEIAAASAPLEADAAEAHYRQAMALAREPTQHKGAAAR